MKIARFDGGLGRVEGESLLPFTGDPDVLELLAWDPEERAAQPVGDPLPLDGVRLLPPLQPPSIRDFVAFEEHVAGIVKNAGPDAAIVPEWYEAPTFYFTNPHALYGANDPVPIPPGCAMFDFELEVAAVIGHEGHDLGVEEAHGCIAAYTVFNDWSARDLQWREMRVGLGPAKGKDSATTLGPWLVTADELEPYRRDDRLHLALEARVNGETIGRDSLASMNWSFEELVAYASRGTKVAPGDVLGSGTCGGGCLAELWGRAGRHEPPPLQAGDRVTLVVEAIGTTDNEVISG